MGSRTLRGLETSGLGMGGVSIDGSMGNPGSSGRLQV